LALDGRGTDKRKDVGGSPASGSGPKLYRLGEAPIPYSGPKRGFPDGEQSRNAALRISADLTDAKKSIDVDWVFWICSESTHLKACPMCYPTSSAGLDIVGPATTD